MHSKPHTCSVWVLIWPLDWPLYKTSEWRLLNHSDSQILWNLCIAVTCVVTLDKLMESWKFQKAQHWLSTPGAPSTESFPKDWSRVPHTDLVQYPYLDTIHYLNTFDPFCPCDHKGEAVMGLGPLMGKRGSRVRRMLTGGQFKVYLRLNVAVKFQSAVKGYSQEWD